MRLRGLRLAGAGLSVCSPKSSVFSVIDPHQVTDAMHHAARLRGVLDLDRLADAPEPQRAQRLALIVLRAVLALELRDLQGPVRAHAGTSSVPAASPAASVSPFAPAAAASGPPESVSAACFSPPSPRTVLIDRPRSSATSSG